MQAFFKIRSGLEQKSSGFGYVEIIGSYHLEKTVGNCMLVNRAVFWLDSYLKCLEILTKYFQHEVVKCIKRSMVHLYIRTLTCTSTLTAQECLQAYSMCTMQLILADVQKIITPCTGTGT
jgi:hypothetical protein